MVKKVQAKILNYRVIIEKEYYPDGTPVYTAFVPTLGVADYGPTIDKVLKSLKDGIELAIECLVEERKEVPVDKVEETMVVHTQVLAPKSARLVSALK
ncbi:MAG: type II toxin-antitoxin system HicB family antitoxin [Patescibacteria group bacterium]